MKITLTGHDYNRIIKGCTPAIDKYGPRKVLQEIEIVSDGNGNGYATALDGYVMNQIHFQCIGDAGKFLMQPVGKHTGDKYSEIDISWDDHSVSVSDDEITITRHKEKIADLDRKKITDDRVKKGKRYAIACDPRLLVKALKACDSTDKAIVMEFAEELDSIIIRSKQAVSLVLPLRLNYDYEDSMAVFYGASKPRGDGK